MCRLVKQDPFVKTCVVEVDPEVPYVVDGKSESTDIPHSSSHVKIVSFRVCPLSS